MNALRATTVTLFQRFSMRLIYFITLLFLVATLPVKATHIFGGDFGYRHLNGNQYEIYLVLYGDCSGSSFPSLPSAVPEVVIYNGSSQLAVITLNPYGNFGEEVTPVCPEDSNNTACKGGTLPGIARFEFRKAYTLPGLSTNWRFRFEGVLGSNSGAGRSNAITNLVMPSNGSIMALEATLNNTLGPNNTSTFSTIPTPFFCLGQNEQYNMGAVDPDGDILGFSLVPGLIPNGTVNYVSPYTSANPLQVNPGSFSFNTGSGQLNFIPNAVQNSLVVCEVTEKKNGVTVGTSMREMTFIVLNNCNNAVPYVDTANMSLSGASGHLLNAMTFEICNSDSFFQISLPVLDPDGDNLHVSLAGTPNFINTFISNNNTPNPVLNISRDITQNIVTGTYNIYITIQDDGCPLSRRKTVAYTIEVIQPIQYNIVTTSETCTPGNDGSIQMQLNSSFGAVSTSLNGGPYLNTNLFQGLNQGNYTLNFLDAAGCRNSTNVLVDGPEEIHITTSDFKDIRCAGEKNGEIHIKAGPGSNLTYMLYPGGMQNTHGNFYNLDKGSYTVVVANADLCRDTAHLEIKEPLPIALDEINFREPTCKLENGIIRVKSYDAKNPVYSITPKAQTNHTGVFGGLAPGFYIVNVVDENGCEIDSTVYLNEGRDDFHIVAWGEPGNCEGLGEKGKGKIIIEGGVGPYTVWWDTDPPMINQWDIELNTGSYYVTVIDAEGCEQMRNFYVPSPDCCENVFIPNAFTPNQDGNNDFWGITTGADLKINKWCVANRWGEIIWSGQDQLDVWDGKTNNIPQLPGVYFYYIQYKCLTNGENYVQKGDVMIIR